MTVTSWTSDELDRIGAGGVDKEVTFVDARAGIVGAVDDAYREKYARYPSYVPPMLSDHARATTLELVPHDRANTL